MRRSFRHFANKRTLFPVLKSFRSVGMRVTVAVPLLAATSFPARAVSVSSINSDLSGITKQLHSNKQIEERLAWSTVAETAVAILAVGFLYERFYDTGRITVRAARAARRKALQKPSSEAQKSVESNSINLRLTLRRIRSRVTGTWPRP